MSYKCSECGFELWQYIDKVTCYQKDPPFEYLDTEVCHVGLYDDKRYPGRCLVVLEAHREHMEEMTDLEVKNFMACVTRVGRSVKRVTGAKRINYAVLGNAVPHVHAHVIPRFETDPNPNSSPWSRPDEAQPLLKVESQTLIKEIRASLSMNL